MGYTQRWIDIINEVRDFTDANTIAWFRGHSDEDYELHSGMFREKWETIEQFLSIERMRYTQFRNIGHLHHKEEDWNLLYIMQHHGVKTRLLDWSESFANALFFAYSQWEITKKNACIWLLNPLLLNKSSLDHENILMLNNKSYNNDSPVTFRSYDDALYNHNSNTFIKNSVAILPLKNSQRVVVQQGVFTVQGNSMKPLDKENNSKLFSQGILKKIILTPNLQDDIRLYLIQSGVNYYTLFPDLDGLAKHVNEPQFLKSESVFDDIVNQSKEKLLDNPPI